MHSRTSTGRAFQTSEEGFSKARVALRGVRKKTMLALILLQLAGAAQILVHKGGREYSLHGLARLATARSDRSKSVLHAKGTCQTGHVQVHAVPFCLDWQSVAIFAYVTSELVFQASGQAPAIPLQHVGIASQPAQCGRQACSQEVRRVIQEGRKKAANRCQSNGNQHPLSPAP